jgi:alpha-ribazole phosphatase
MAVTTLRVIRHAKVAVSGLCYGRLQVPLTVSAQEAASQMIQRGGLQLDAVWSSPAPRCSEPAAIWAAAAKAPHHVDARLWELAYGDWEGLAWDDVPRVSMDHWAEDWIHRAPPGGESARDLEGRVRSWIESLPRGHYGLSAHAGVIRALQVVVNGIAWPAAMQCPAPHLEAVEFCW